MLSVDQEDLFILQLVEVGFQIFTLEFKSKLKRNRWMKMLQTPIAKFSPKEPDEYTPSPKATR
jgi:hypothetical protein